MTQQVYAPQQKQNDGLGKLFTVAGGIVGGIYGGPGGAMAGAGAGQTAGGMLTPQQAPVQTVEAGSSNPMARRIQSDDTLKQLRDAQTSLAELPPEQQQQYAAPINQAYAMEAKRRGMNNVG